MHNPAKSSYMSIFSIPKLRFLCNEIHIVRSRLMLRVTKCWIMIKHKMRGRGFCNQSWGVSSNPPSKSTYHFRKTMESAGMVSSVCTKFWYLLNKHTLPEETKPSVKPHDVAVFQVGRLAIWFCWTNKQSSCKRKIETMTPLNLREILQFSQMFLDRPIILI